MARPVPHFIAARGPQRVYFPGVPMSALRIIRGYYFATPVFLVVEIVTGLELRVSEYIGSPGWRVAYYGFCFLCMAAIVLRPKISVAIGLIECSTNLIVLFVGTARAWMFPLADSPPVELEVAWRGNPITPTSIASFLLTGSMLILSLRALTRRSQPPHC